MPFDPSALAQAGTGAISVAQSLAQIYANVNPGIGYAQGQRDRQKDLLEALQQKRLDAQFEFDKQKQEQAVAQQQKQFQLDIFKEMAAQKNADRAAAIQIRGQDLTSVNAEAAREVTMRGQDIAKENAALSAMIQVRGQDLVFENARKAQELTMRGQDIAMRGQDINQATAIRGQDITMRGQDINQATAVRGQDINQATAIRGQDINQATAVRGQDINQATAVRGQDITMRGQDINQATAVRGQDINNANALERLALDREKFQQDVFNTQRQFEVDTAYKNSLIAANEWSRDPSNPQNLKTLIDIKLAEKNLSTPLSNEGKLASDIKNNPALAPLIKLQMSQAKAPPGYAWKDSGDMTKGLYPIEGGPAFKQTPQQAAASAALIAALDDFNNAVKLIQDPNTKEINDRVLVQSFLPNTEGYQFKAAFKRVLTSKLRLESGAAVPDTEVDRYVDIFMPSVLNTEEGNRQILDNMRTFLNMSFSGIANQNGVLLDPSVVFKGLSQGYTIAQIREFEEKKRINNG